MSQTRLFVQTNEPTAERLLDLFEMHFEEDGFAIATNEVCEETKTWHASVYVMNDEAERVAPRLTQLIQAQQLDLQVQTEVLPDIDWVAKSLEGLKPVEVTRFFIHGSHDQNLVKPHHLPIKIDAAQAFGTGHHGTTSGCLEMIYDVCKRAHQGLRAQEPILDLGTGSGVLAIAAAKLSHARILATDIDPIATHTAKANAQINQAAHLVDFKTINGLNSPIFAQRGPFGLIIANILAKPLMTMAPKITEHLMPDGTLILSGILKEQRWKVLSAFNRQGLSHQKTIWRDGWVTMILRK